MEKYFLNAEGVPTRRMRGAPGERHIDIAHEILVGPLEPGTDIYTRLAELGFVRVEETDTVVLVDAPRPLNSHQKRFLQGKEGEGKRVLVNTTEFIARRSKAPARC